MVTKPNNYAIWPAILKADEVNTVTITATERAFFFVEGASYELTIIGVNNDETDYHDPVSHRRVSCVAQGGYLKFDYKFEGEQEFIFIIKDEKLITHPESCDILPGIIRKFIIKNAAVIGFLVAERGFTVDEIIDADEVVVTSTTKLAAIANSVNGIAVGGKSKYIANALIDTLFKSYQNI
jgi:hypothetical protein